MQNNRAAFTEEVVEAYKFMFSQPHGLTCPINYYRRMFTQVTAPGKKTKVEPPTLLIWVSSVGTLVAAYKRACKCVCVYASVSRTSFTECLALWVWLFLKGFT